VVMNGPLIAVSTCLRPGGVSYLRETLRSLEAAGASNFPKIVFSNGPIPPIDICPWPCQETTTASSRSNLVAAISMAANLNAERLLFFEDDILACVGAVERMATVKIPGDVSFMTFHDLKELQNDETMRPSVMRVPAKGFDGRGFWGNQAIAIPNLTLRYLAKKDFFSIRRDELPGGGDSSIGDLAASSPRPFFSVHIPSLVRHTGAVSVAHPGAQLGKRQPRNYRGDSFDAHQLVRSDASSSDLIVVMTSPRPGVSYLNETLESLDSEGAGRHPNKIVVSDGPLDESCSWQKVVTDGPSGTKKALWKVFRMAVSFPRASEHLILFEDDVIPCRNAVTRVLATSVPPGAPFVSFFDYRSLDEPAKNGIHFLNRESTKGGRYWGFPAIKFPMDVVEFLARTDMESFLPGNKDASDTVVDDILKTLSPWKDVAIHCPSLFEHGGEVSSRGDRAGFHRAKNFRGVDFDALSLPLYGL